MVKSKQMLVTPCSALQKAQNPALCPVSPRAVLGGAAVPGTGLFLGGWWGWHSWCVGLAGQSCGETSPRAGALGASGGYKAEQGGTAKQVAPRG